MLMIYDNRYTRCKRVTLVDSQWQPEESLKGKGCKSITKSQILWCVEDSFFSPTTCDNVECLLRAKILTVDLSCLATKPWDLNTALYENKSKKLLQICCEHLKIGQTQTLWGLKVLEDNTPTVSSPWKCHLQQRGLCAPKQHKQYNKYNEIRKGASSIWTSSVQMMLIRLMFFWTFHCPGKRTREF